MTRADFKLRDDWEMMMWAYKSKNVTTKQTCKKILDEKGVCWSSMLNIPGFSPTKSALLDMMHNLLGKWNLQVKQLFIYHDHP
jgi:hypothetical protein